MRKISQHSINKKFIKKLLVVTVVAMALVGTLWKAKTPGLKAEIMLGIGHMPMLAAPEQTAELVKNFIFSKMPPDL